ncbi:MAG: hypothetical protein A2583_13055 [Bdellovibrionales bacterium RIFOXYD1_FULL_53_11]|nr:MAG: hypothetical protein A2583_13055 [Bdellovibrionales bacterium RIFOXYD1_FULL_53_11]
MLTRKIIVLILTLISLNVYSKEISKKTIGTFLNLIYSDYLYLTIKGSDGKAQDYYCNLPICAEWEMNQSGFKEKKVIVTWRFKNMFFKEIKKEQNIRECLDLKLEK